MRQILSVLVFSLGMLGIAEGSLRDDIVSHIENAHQSIDVLVYIVASDAIASALVEASVKGVRVRVILDAQRTTGPTKAEEFLQDNKISIRTLGLANVTMLHDKFILIDGTEAATPSYNRSDFQNDGETGEGFTSDKKTIRHLKEEFERVWRQAK